MTTIVSPETSATPGASAVSWGAIIAGAVAAAAFALVLTVLGAGVGLAAISPWGNSGTGTKVGYLAAAWALAVHLFSFGLGGYIAGRLRVRWADAQADEVYFRDTAHGLLVWALGAIAGAWMAVGLAAGAGQVAGQVVGGAAVSSARTDAGPLTYFNDMLFRSANPPAANAEAARSEVVRLFTRAVAGTGFTEADRAYASQAIARQTGIPPAEAEKRFLQTVEQAKNAAEAARKAAMFAALWTLLALLLGAFSAAYMATVGASDRDKP